MLDLENYDDDFTPDLKAKVDDLADGEYEMEIKSAALKQAKAYVILEMSVKVLSEGKHAGQEVQHAFFIADKDGANRVGRDLATLGFDCKEWTKENGRPFSAEFPKVPKCLAGVRFRAKKVTSPGKDNGKVYHNLYINKRLATDGLPEHFGPAELNATDPDVPF